MSLGGDICFERSENSVLSKHKTLSAPIQIRIGQMNDSICINNVVVWIDMDLRIKRSYISHY